LGVCRCVSVASRGGLLWSSGRVQWASVRACRPLMSEFRLSASAANCATCAFFSFSAAKCLFCSARRASRA
jgi:hypothetical protein